MVAIRVSALILISVLATSAQDPVSEDFMYHRVWAVVPLVGKGTSEDPKRPMFVPSPAERKADALRREKTREDGEKIVDPPAIISYRMQVTDDGKSALVEFVGLNPKALAFITQSRAPGVTVFERGKIDPGEIEAEFRKHKADFSFESLAGRSAQ